MVSAPVKLVPKPSSARRMAGAITWERVMVPYFSSMTSRVFNRPGMATDCPPKSFHSSCTTPSFRNRSSLAFWGATPRPSTEWNALSLAL